MNRILKTLLSIVAFSGTVVLAQQSLAAGFSQGNELTIQRIQGHMTLICQAPGQQSKYISCEADLWTPGLTDHFVGPVADADKVTLTSTRADGSTKSKDSKYDGKVGKSKSAFNLGIWTLTQKPLLKEGANQVRFELSKGEEAVTDGEFIATVTRLQSRACPHSSEFAYGNECDFPQNACERYFQRHNYCQ